MMRKMMEWNWRDTMIRGRRDWVSKRDRIETRILRDKSTLRVLRCDGIRCVGGELSGRVCQWSVDGLMKTYLGRKVVEA